MNFLKQMNRRAVAATAVSAGLLVPLGIFGAPALARTASSADQYSGSSQYQYKISVCHKTHSKKHPWRLIKVSSASWKAHQKHGDFLVTPTTPCPPATTAAPTTTTSSTHGKSGDHGNNGNHGKGHGK